MQLFELKLILNLFVLKTYFKELMIHLNGLARLDMPRRNVPFPSALLLRLLDQQDLRSAVVLAQDHADRDVRDVVEDADPAASCKATERCLRLDRC